MLSSACTGSWGLKLHPAHALLLLLSHTLFAEDHLRVATENGADDKGPEDRVKTLASEAST